MNPSNYSALSLDELIGLSPDDLKSRFLSSDCPSTLEVLDGAHRGVILAFTRLIRHGPLVRRFMNSDLFPWDGKIFEANSPYDGQGANRIRLAGERHLLRFSTRLERSILDDRPTVVLDYDEPGNFLAPVNFGTATIPRQLPRTLP